MFKINNREGKSSWGKVIFAPEKIESSKINVATASWDVPFRVANFIYLWDKRYELDPDGNIVLPKWLPSSAPADFKIKFVQDSNLSIDQSGINCPYFDFNYNKIIYYDKDAFGKVDDVKGYVCFKDENDNFERSFFYGEAMMMGAIFAEDKESFDCVKNVAVDRLKIVNEV